MGGLLSAVAGRRGKWATVGAWLLAVTLALALDLPARYADAQEAGATAFLPEGAESTRAIVAQRESGAERTPIAIVYRRAGGLTPDDLRRSRRDLLELRAARRAQPDVYRGVRSFDEPVASHDGDAQLIVADAVSVGGSEGLVDAVADIRARVSEPTGGLRVSVTGPAGFVADAEEVFETIDARLYLGALLLVVLLLAVIYRSPVLLVLPLVAVGVAELMTRALGFPLAELGVPVTDQSSSIVSVLVLGAGTDYALLLVARYREELRRHPDRHDAMAPALRAAGPAIVASALTVIAALLCLLLADVPATRGLGPMAALGVAVAMLAMITLLPALLAIAGRRVFWRPRLLGRDDGIPRFGDSAPDPMARRWRRVGERVAGRPRDVWMATAAGLAVMAVGWIAMDTGLTQTEAFRGEVESVAGQRMIADSFSEGAGAPTAVLVPSTRFDAVPAVEAALRGVQGVAEVTAGDSYPGGIVLDVVLDVDPYSAEAYALVGTLREAARAAGGDGVLVGGASAVEADVRTAAAADNRVIAPMTLLVVLVVLIVVLRAVTGPLALVGTVVLSFAAALGFSVLVFDLLFGFPGIDPSLPLFAFVFLVALGVDYNIFLMARVREEARRHGTREGVLRALAVTGGVITSAGVVLAGTFAVLAVLPLVFLTEIGFVIAFGVLLDTLVVRSVLVPAIVLDLDRRTWWPSRLARARRD